MSQRKWIVQTSDGLRHHVLTSCDSMSPKIIEAEISELMRVRAFKPLQPVQKNYKPGSIAWIDLVSENK